jgi:EAL domain-containing protein (putative c-di-GMP-specific phosphodiesterase class I)
MVNLDESLSDAFLRRHVEFVRERGSRVALDDLDSSFLACHWIAELRPDYVKLDRSLVACLESSGSARSTLETITEFARQSGIRAVAEGIETPEQARICSESGVELLQGFLLARPANPPLAINKSFRTSSLAA